MKYEQPVEAKEDGPMEGTRITHPCFAQIGASRVMGSASLYGSDFEHNNYVEITVRSSELHRSLSRDWHFGRGELISVKLSEAQWATFVSAMNAGSGTPCTLVHTNRESVPQLESPVNSTDKFDAEMVDRMAVAESELENLRHLIRNEKSLSGKKKEALISKVDCAKMNISSNVKFVAEQFGEHMEDTKEKAKIEIEAYLRNTIARAGIESLQADAPLQLKEGTRCK